MNTTTRSPAAVSEVAVSFVKFLRDSEGSARAAYYKAHHLVRDHMRPLSADAATLANRSEAWMNS